VEFTKKMLFYTNVMRHLPLLIFLFIFLTGCCRNNGSEDPFVVARTYCDCLHAKLNKAADSSVNINECNPVYGSSRLINIYIENDKDKYSQYTLDSASRFFHQVHDIIDTLCYNKIDLGKIKRGRHA
jgi:hypothetical protein